MGKKTESKHGKRVARACNSCRNKRNKCDGLRPACSACVTHSLTCIYDPTTKKRGLPEGYVRGLEALLGLSVCTVNGFEHKLFSLLHATAGSVNQPGQLRSYLTDGRGPNKLQKSWKTSRLYHALEMTLSEPGKISLHDESARACGHDYFDASVGMQVSSELHFSSGSELSQDGPKEMEACESPFLASPGFSDNGVGVYATNAAHIPPLLPAQTLQLIDGYFALTQPWFPILTKENVLRAFYLFRKESVSVRKAGPGSGDHATLWALLSYATSHSCTSRPEETLQANSKTKDYYLASRDLIPSEGELYELGHVQALLLLALVDIGLEQWKAAWLLSGKASDMALSMGLGNFEGLEGSEELQRGRAVFLGCFVLDSLLAFRVSQRPHIASQSLTAMGLLKEDGFEEWSPWSELLQWHPGGRLKDVPRPGPIHALRCFNQLVELAGIVNHFSQGLITGQTAYEIAQRLVIKLRSWDNRLPLGCRLIGPDSIYPERHSALLPHETYLTLTYIATLLRLYLCIAPYEIELHRPQQPALDGAKKLLYRVLLVISQHFENFPGSGLPPIFEVSLHTIITQAQSLRDHISPKTFPFQRWAEELYQKTTQHHPIWPVYHSLNARLEHQHHTWE